MPADAVTGSVEFRSLGGLRLRGTLVVPSRSARSATVLVHGGGVTREEGGFFTRLAAGLADAGIATPRFDFRAHGESEGRQEDLTIAGVVNDIRAAVRQVREAAGSNPVNLAGASFGGGITAFFATRYPDQVRRLVLLNPLLNYKKRFIGDKPGWHDDQLAEAAAQQRQSSRSPGPRPGSWRSTAPSTASPCTTTRSTCTRRPACVVSHS